MAPPLSSSPAELDVTVVLPVHNEAGHLDAELARIRTSLEASGYSWEIIVVDDASTDGSVDNLVPGNGIRLIRQRVNQGSGGSRRVGTEAARGAVVVWTDADMTYPNDRIAELVGQLEGADQVVGARTTEEGTHKVLRTAAKWLIRRLAQYLASTEIPDLNSGYRAFRRDVAWQYTHLLPKGFSCVTTLTMAFLTNGYTVRYVEIEYRERAGESKFHWYRDTPVCGSGRSDGPVVGTPPSVPANLAADPPCDRHQGAHRLRFRRTTAGGVDDVDGHVRRTPPGNRLLGRPGGRTSKAPSRVLPAYVVEVPEPDAERGGT